MSDTEPPIRQRIDKWLWHARMARTRTLAARLVSDGHVRVDSKRVTDPAKKIRAGDILTLALPQATIVITVLDFAERRGPAREAQQLYRLLSAPDTAGHDPAHDDPAGHAPVSRDPLRHDPLRNDDPMRNFDIGDDDGALAPDDDSR